VLIIFRSRFLGVGVWC